MRYLLETVKELHDRGITHRDIRLPNFVETIDDDGGSNSYRHVDWDDSIVGLKDLANEDVVQLVRETPA